MVMARGQSRGPEDGSTSNDEGDSVPRIDDWQKRGPTMSGRRGVEGIEGQGTQGMLLCASSNRRMAGRQVGQVQLTPRL